MKFSEVLDESFYSANNKLYGDATISDGFNFDFRKAKNSIISFSDGVVLKKISITMSGASKLCIGEKSKIYGRILISHSSEVSIGNFVKFNGVCRLHAAEGKKILIGDNCLFSNVRFRTSDSHSVIDLKDNKRINHAKDIIVENNVWIAEEVFVYKGAHIGEGSIVGAHAKVYSGYLPSNSLSLGCPAKVVKSNISWRDELID